MVIYMAHNKINNKVYIGQSTQKLHIRINKHYCDSEKYNYAFANALKKYSKDDWVWIIICANIPKSGLCIMEKTAIRVFDSYRRGYNSTRGGEDNPMNYAEFRDKVRKSKLGKKRPDQAKRITELNIKREYSEEDRKRISERIKGKDNPMYGKKHRHESRLAMSVGSGSKPFCVYKDKKLIGEWINKVECARFLGIDNSSITKYLNGKQKNSLGYIFKYIGD